MNVSDQLTILLVCMWILHGLWEPSNPVIKGWTPNIIYCTEDVVWIPD